MTDVQSYKCQTCGTTLHRYDIDRLVLVEIELIEKVHECLGNAMLLVSDLMTLTGERVPKLESDVFILERLQQIREGFLETYSQVEKRIGKQVAGKGTIDE